MIIACLQGALQNLIVIHESIQLKISDFSTEGVTGPLPLAFRKNCVLYAKTGEEFS